MSDSTLPSEDLFCPRCGYDLRALRGDGPCPECGEALDLAQLRRSQIPWTYRRDLGWVRAYWRTVWLVMFRNRRFYREIARPVSFPDAQLFRWVTIAHVLVTVGVLTLALAPFADYPWPKIAVDAVWPIVAIHALLFLYLVAVTGIASYWFHPRHLDVRRQNRAVALSYYCCAPLAWTPLTAALLGIGWMTWKVQKYFLAETTLSLILAAGLALAGLQLVQLWGLPVLAAKRMTGRSGLGLLSLAIGLPLAWAVLAALIFVGIPLVVGFVWLVFASFG